MKDLSKKNVLIVYTGGTIGMKNTDEGYAPVSGYLLDELKKIDDLNRGGMPKWDFVELSPLLDSSNVSFIEWNSIAKIIVDNYANYDGFVILHGTDTMAYSASALSFMIEGLTKPVVFTGSQLPIGTPRTDGKENLISSVEIAAAKDADGHALVPEVCIYFDNVLMRGNRASKINSDHFRAFRSPNFQPLAEAGIHIRYNNVLIIKPLYWERKPIFHKELDTRVSILKMHPGITPQIVETILCGNDTRAIIIETYGAGNAPSKEWFLKIVQEAAGMGKIILNVTQCIAGSVNMDIYATGKCLKDAGVVSGYDSTTEAALAKLMYLFGLGLSSEEVKQAMRSSYVGEITLPRNN